MYTIFSPVCLESRISWIVRFFLSGGFGAVEDKGRLKIDSELIDY
jgi:hypothetical protein